MAGRRQRKRAASPHVPLRMDRLASIPRSQVRGEVTYQVQYLSSAAKSYTCPGCFNSIAPGSSHVVAWATEGNFGIELGMETRRHWHTSCWRRGHNR